MHRFFDRLIAGQARWARPLGDFNHRWLHALFKPMLPVRDLLNGRWLGHPLHSVLTDAPIGILFLVIVFDVVGQPAAAGWALLIGVLAMGGAALAGLADYADTDGISRERATPSTTYRTRATVMSDAWSVARSREMPSVSA